MRFLLLVAICSLAVFASADDKKKRDILPGDPRYGTDYHHNHQHNHVHENGIEVSRSLGGYVGSYAVPEVNTVYGPPGYQPGKPIVIDQLPTVVENKVEVSSPSYGVPEVETVKEVNNAYLPPVVIESKKVQQFHIPKTTVHQETLHTDFVAPSIATPVVSNESSVTVEAKTVPQIQNPTVSYGVPPFKTTIEPTPSEVKVETGVSHETSQVVPKVNVQSHVEHQETLTSYPKEEVHDAPAIDARLLKTNVGVLPSADLSAFSNAGSVSFNGVSTLGNDGFNQAHLVGLDTAYGLGTNSHQFGTHYPNFYGNQFGSSGSYDVSLPQSYNVPHTFYAQQTYSPVATPYSLPYALSKTASLPSLRSGVDQKTGPISDFFQENFPNFQFPQLPQLPQLPQFPDLGSLFQLPTQAPPAVPLDTTDPEVQKHSQGKVYEVSNKHLVKSVPVSVDDTSRKETTVVTKTTKEYTQPLAPNNGYAY